MVSSYLDNGVLMEINHPELRQAVQDSGASGLSGGDTVKEEIEKGFW